VVYRLLRSCTCTRLSVTLGALEARKGSKEDALPYTRTSESELVNRIRPCDAHLFAVHWRRGDVCLCVEQICWRHLPQGHTVPATSRRDVCPTTARPARFEHLQTRRRSKLSPLIYTVYIYPSLASHRHVRHRHSTGTLKSTSLHPRERTC
jgi:hypothetical protein